MDQAVPEQFGGGREGREETLKLGSPAFSKNGLLLLQ